MAADVVLILKGWMGFGLLDKSAVGSKRKCCFGRGGLYLWSEKKVRMGGIGFLTQGKTAERREI